MSSAIKAIDKTTVHRICSGQVVLSLGIAVKELVENAIDAGATSVEVKLREYGSELIEVSDNGHGVHPENFEGLTLKHHTSKLRDFSDLMGVETFGFRGEALSSLCALSELSVSTRHKSMNCGSAIKFDRSGKILENKPCARQIGTTVSLSNIFHTLPVRHKEFNRNLKKEFNKMLQLLYAYCMVSTEVRITCTNQTKKGNKNVVVATQGSNSVKENVSCIFGAKQLSSLLELKTTLPPPEELDELKADEGACSIFQLDGLVSSCAHGSGRSTPDRQFYFINSRPCDPSKVSKAVNEIYHHYNLHQYPFVYLNINVAHESVDVNVTPDKRQLFLDNEKLLIAIIKASLDRVYKNIPSTFILNNIPIKTTSPASVPKTDNAKPNLSLFSQWRSKNDCFKRTLEDSDCEANKRKVIKLEDDHRKQSTQPKLRKFVTKTPSVDREEEGLNDFSGHLAADHLESLENSELTNDTNIILSKSELCKSSALKHEDNNSEEGAPLNTCSNTGLVAYFSVVDDIVREESASPVPTSWSLDTATHSLPTVEIQPTPETSEGLESAPMKILEEYLENYSSSESFITAETLTLSQSMSSKSVIYDSYEERGKRCVTIPMDISRLKTLCKKWVKRDNTIEKVRFRAAIDPSKNDQAEDELKKEITKDKFQVMEIIGQFNLGFIITKLDTDLFIIDQHAADEKFNFETLQKNTVIKNQKLVVPQQLELTAANESVLMDNLEVFKKNGFEFRINEDAPPTKKVSMTAVPLSVNRVFGKEDVDELIFMLQDVSDGDVNCRPSGVRAMFASRACRKSVMVGTALDSKEMKRLVFQMGTIEHPWNCPHGRPTMRHLVNMELVKKI